jgi:hypothetical protein
MLQYMTRPQYYAMAHPPALLTWHRTSFLIFAFTLQLLLLHHHMLYTFTHPRQDSYMLLLLEVLGCARRYLVAGYAKFQPLAKRAGTTLFLGLVAALYSIAGISMLWHAFFSGRPLVDMVLLLPPLIAVAHDPGLDSNSWQGAHFAEHVRALVLDCAEAAFYVGALPSIFARNDFILHEHHESCRIALLTFCNCLVLELLELLCSITPERLQLEGWLDASSAGGAELPTPSAAHADGSAAAAMAITSGGSASAVPSSCRAAGASSSGKRASGGGSGSGGAAGMAAGMAARGAKRGGAVVVADDCPHDQGKPELGKSELLRFYLENTDRVHMAIVYGQSALVCVLLAHFLHTHHWRTHAVTLVSNYGLLCLCVLFRKHSRERASATAAAS